jgi:glutamate/tyrosine decarboxylase-like PLP-dependent enzyme
MEQLLRATAARACRYRRDITSRRVAPSPDAIAALSQLDGPMPEGPEDDETVIALLDEIGSPATVASAGGRFFGFVIGSSLPVTVAANWLAAAWDQNGGMVALSPVAARIEQVATAWMLDVLGLPAQCGSGFVTCATQANLCGLAAARHALLARHGWDVEARGLFQAPPIRSWSETKRTSAS